MRKLFQASASSDATCPIFYLFAASCACLNVSSISHTSLTADKHNKGFCPTQRNYIKLSAPAKPRLPFEAP